MGSKVCNKCNVEKPLSDFYKRKDSKDGYRGECKDCKNEYFKCYYENNKENVKTKNKLWRLDNHDKIIERNIEWKNNNPEKYKEIQKKYNLKNKDKIREYKNKWNKEKKKTDPSYNLRCSMNRTISDTLKNKDYSKKSKVCDILGCDFNELKTHLESMFEDWMSWDNYGNPNDGIVEVNKSWDIDHIIPLSSAETEDDILRLNHYSNLQPLCSYVNRFIKKDRKDFYSTPT